MRAEQLNKETDQFRQEAHRSRQRRSASEPGNRERHSDGEADLSDAGQHDHQDDRIPSHVVDDIGRGSAKRHSQSAPTPGRIAIAGPRHESEKARFHEDIARSIVSAGQHGQTIQVFFGDRTEVERTPTHRNAPIPGMQLEKFNPDTTDPAAYLRDFALWLDLQGVPPTKWVNAFIMLVKEEEVRATLLDIKRGRMKYKDHLMQVTDAFMEHYGMTEHVLRNLQHKQRSVVKQAQEPVRDYIKRWELGFNGAWPKGTDRAGSSTAEKAAMFVRNLERDMQQDYQRLILGSEKLQAENIKWIDVKASIMGLYDARDPGKSYIAGAHQIAHEEVEETKATPQIPNSSLGLTGSV
jgi:hypothetical protein